jgi:hypothetical protein
MATVHCISLPKLASIITDWRKSLFFAVGGLRPECCMGFIVACPPFAASFVVSQIKPNLPLRDRRKSLHFLHLVCQAVDIFDQNLNDGRRAVVAAL